MNVPHWLKVPRTRNLFGGVADTLPVIPPGGEVREMYTTAATTSPISAGSKLGNGGDLTYSILETPDAPIDDDIAEKFRNYFAYDERETLLGRASQTLTLNVTDRDACRFSGIHIPLTAGLWSAVYFPQSLLLQVFWTINCSNKGKTSFLSCSCEG